MPSSTASFGAFLTNDLIVRESEQRHADAVTVQYKLGTFKDKTENIRGVCVSWITKTYQSCLPGNIQSKQSCSLQFIQSKQNSFPSSSSQSTAARSVYPVKAQLLPRFIQLNQCSSLSYIPKQVPFSSKQCVLY